MDLHKRVRRTFFSFSGVTVCAFIVIFSTVWSKPQRCDEFNADKRIRKIVNFCDKNWREKLGKPVATKSDFLEGLPVAKTIFMSADKNTLFLGTGRAEYNFKHDFLAMDRKTLKIKKRFLFYTIARGMCFQGKCFLLVPYEKTLVVLDEKTLQKIKVIKIHSDSEFIAVDSVTSSVFIPGIIKKVLDRIDTKTLKRLTYEEKRDSSSGPAYGILIEPHSRKLFVTWMHIIFPNCFGVMNMDQLPSYMPREICFSPLRGFLNFGLLTGLALSYKQNELFVAAPFEASIYILDLKTLQLKETMKFPIGLSRDLAFDEERQILFVPHYVTGYLYVVSTKEREIIKKIFIGRLNRHLWFDPEEKKLFAATANGFMEVDPY